MKVKLYPNSTQKQIIASQIGGNRYIYNRMLALKKFAYTRFGMNIGKYDLMKHIVKLKKRDSTLWLKDVHAQSLQQSIVNMDSAYKHFFKGKGFPKFKSKHNSRQTYQYPQNVKINKNKIYLPKVGWVRCRGLRKDFIGNIKTVTIVYEAYQYSASILVELPDAHTVPLPKNGMGTPRDIIGLDVGVKLLVADSNGKKTKALDLKRNINKLKLKAKQLSNKQRGSNNRLKSKQLLVKQHRKITDIRNNFLHKLSHTYAESQSIVVIEDLKISSMTKSIVGTIKNPSANSKQQKNLNNVIIQQSWGIFFKMLEYKLNARGGKLIRVNPEFTSQECSECNYISKDNRLSQSKFLCVKCNHSENADINASKNIRYRGIKIHYTEYAA